MVVKEGSKYFVLSEKKDPKTGERKRLGGPFPTEEAAKKRLQQIEFFKHRGD